MDLDEWGIAEEKKSEIKISAQHPPRIISRERLGFIDPGRRAYSHAPTLWQVNLWSDHRPEVSSQSALCPGSMNRNTSLLHAIVLSLIM